MSTTKRIEYIDALRGFTMILVVVYHMSATMFNVTEETTSYSNYLFQFRMPLFFFISGFVFFKKERIWDFANTCSFIMKKFKVQILSTAIFFILLLHIEDISLTEGLFSRYKNGYWFTVTLFEFFLLHIALEQGCKLLKFKNIATDIIIFIIGIVFFKIHKIMLMLGVSDNIMGLIGIPQWEFFSYFIFGVLAHKYYTAFEHILDNGILVTLCILAYFLLNIYQDAYIPASLHKNLCMIIYGYTGIIIVFAIFRKYRDRFKKENTLGKSLQFIGRRTLDIYLLHFFFMPKERMQILPILDEINMPLIEFGCSMLLAAMVISGCLIVSSAIRLSPQLAHYLFGAKKEYK